MSIVRTVLRLSLAALGVRRLGLMIDVQMPELDRLTTEVLLELGSGATKHGHGRQLARA